MNGISFQTQPFLFIALDTLMIKKCIQKKDMQSLF